MPDQIRAAVAVTREVIEGKGHRDALHKAIAELLGAGTYRNPEAAMARAKKKIVRLMAKRFMPQAQEIGERSSKPVLTALDGPGLAERHSSLRGAMLRDMKGYSRRALHAFEAELEAEGVTFSSQVTAAFARARRDDVARQRLIDDLVKADKAEHASLTKAHAEIDDAAERLKGAEAKAAKSPRSKKAQRELDSARGDLRKAKAKPGRVTGMLARFETAVQGHARDAIRRQTQEAQVRCFRQAGYKTYTWVAVNGTDACPSCSALHGKTMAYAQWRGRGPGEGQTYCGSSCMCQLVPNKYVAGNRALERPVRA